MADKSTEQVSSTETTTAKPQFVIFKSLSRLGFYFILGLSLFFAVSVLVFLLRNRAAVQSNMADLVGKYYTDVRNELGRAQLRVEIETREFGDVTPGQVLYQSISPGAKISPRDKLLLIVSQAPPLLPMPRLEGNTLQSAKAALARLTHQERVYSVSVGAVSTIPNDAPKGIILAQFPPAGERISVSSKAYLLVSSGPGRKGRRSSFKLKEKDLIGQEISVLRKLFETRGLEYRIKETKEPPLENHTGQVYSVEVDEGGTYRLGVYYRAASARLRGGYEKLELSLASGGECRAELAELPAADKQTKVAPAEPASQKKQTVFLTRKPAENEKVQVIFYRRGTQQINAVCGEKSILKRTLKPDDLS